MKNQNDIIVAAIAFVLMLIFVAVSFFMKPDPVIPPAPEVIDQKMPALPAGDVVMADSLPGGQTGGGSGGAGGGRAGGGGAARPPAPGAGAGSGGGGNSGLRGPMAAGG